MNTLIRHFAITLLLSAGAMLASISTANAAPNYKVSKAVPLGAPDRWDYVTYDASTGRAYVAHGDRVTVVDVKSGKVVGEVEGMPGGTHGIGINDALNRGFTDDGKAGTVAVFDLSTLKVTKTLPAASDADGIVFDASSAHFFVINGDSGTLTVIDPKTETVVANINVGGKLEFAASDGHGKLYVNGAEKKEIVRIDTATNQVDAHWSIANCTSPHGLAIDAESHRLFPSCVNNLLVVLDTQTGAIVASLPIGSGTDAAAFDPKRKLIFSSNGRDGTLTVIKEIDAFHYEVAATINTAVTARTMTLDPNTGRLFLVAADIDSSAASANGRPKIIPGSAKLLIMDPTP